MLSSNVQMRGFFRALAVVAAPTSATASATAKATTATTTLQIVHSWRVSNHDIMTHTHGVGGGQVAFRPQGCAQRLRCGCGRSALVASFSGVRVQSYAFYSFAVRAAGCCVLLCFRRSSVRWVLRLRPCSCASVLCCCSALVGPFSVLECAY